MKQGYYGVIYKATSPSGKIYIGQTINFKSRIYEHNRIALKKNDKRYKVSLISRAIRKYKPENIKWEIIDKAKNKKELNEKEIYWIDKLKTTNRKIGYNLTNGGTGGDIVSLLSKSKKEKHRKKILKAISGKNNYQWIDIDINKMLELYNQRFSLHDIAKKMKVSRSIITNRLKKLDIKPRTHTKETYKKIAKVQTIEIDENRLKQLVKENYTRKELAKEFNVSTAYIKIKLRKLGIKLDRKKNHNKITKKFIKYFSPQIVRHFRKLYEIDKLPRRAIIKELKITITDFYLIIKNHNLQKREPIYNRSTVY